MRATIRIAALLLALVSGAQAVNPQALAKVNGMLNPFERAFLGGILTNPAEAAAFDAQADALKNPQGTTIFLNAWRVKIYDAAQKAANRPPIDYSRRYRSYSEMMTTAEQAYLLAITPHLPEEKRAKLAKYLPIANELLGETGGQVAPGPAELSISNWFTTPKPARVGFIVSEVITAFREHGNSYVGSAFGQQAARARATAQGELDRHLASLRQPAAPAAPVVPAPAAPVVPAPAAPAGSVANIPRPIRPAQPNAPPDAPAAPDLPQLPQPAPEPVTRVTPPAGGAREQLERMERAGPNAGGHFDGGVTNGPARPGSVATAGPVRTRLDPNPEAPLSRPNLLGNVPAPPGASFEQQLQSQLGPGAHGNKVLDNGKWIAGGVGALLGGLAGFLLFGPIGAAIGALVLGGAALFGAIKLIP